MTRPLRGLLTNMTWEAPRRTQSSSCSRRNCPGRQRPTWFRPAATAGSPRFWQRTVSLRTLHPFCKGRHVSGEVGEEFSEASPERLCRGVWPHRVLLWLVLLGLLDGWQIRLHYQGLEFLQRPLRADGYFRMKSHHGMSMLAPALSIRKLWAATASSARPSPLT